MKNFIALMMCLVLTFGYVNVAKAAAPQTTRDFRNSISEGTLAGYGNHILNTYFEGFNSAGTYYVASGVEGQTDYYFPETAEVFNLVSDNTADTQEILVEYLDSNWDLKTTIIELDGTTPVEGTLAVRVHKIMIYEGTNNVGLISCYKDGGSPSTPNDVFCNIIENEGMSHSLVHSVPRNTMFIIQALESSSFSTADNVMVMKKRDYGNDFWLNVISVPFEKTRSLNQKGQMQVSKNGKTDFLILIKSSTTGQELMVKFNAYSKKVN